MKIKTIVLHHTATSGTGDGSGEWVAIKRNIHPKRPPEYLCDYHWGIGPTGVVFPGQLENNPCWHCGNDDINNASLAVACIGNFEEHPMGVEQERALIDFILVLKRKYPLAWVRIHKEIVATNCPGRFYPTRKVLDALAGLRGSGSGSVGGKKRFSDLDESNIFYNAIMVVVGKGIMNGDSEGTFRPSEFVTRGELAQVLCNYMEKG